MGAFLSCGVLGARRGKRNAGEGICHGAGDVGAWGRFFGHDGQEGDGFPATFPAPETWAMGACVSGGFLSVTREGESVRRAASGAAGGVASARGAGTARQAMSGDGAGSAEEVAAGGGVGVPCG